MNASWSHMLLGDLIELKRGYDLPKKQRVAGHVPLISSAGLSDCHDEAKVKGPGVITGRYGTIGEVFYIKDDFWPLNTTLYVKDFKGNHPKFIYYFLKTINYLQFSDKAAVPGVNRNHLHKASILVPLNIEEQKQIAKILSDLDDKIHLNNQINQTLESIAQALFKSWFIDFDPVRAKVAANQEGKDPELAAMCAISGKSEVELQQMTEDDLAELRATASLFPDELVESELGEMPKGWELQSLYDTAEFVNGAAFKAKDFSSNTNEGLPIIKIAELKQGLSAQTKYTNLSFDQKYRVRSGDIFYSWSGSPETSLDVFKWFGGDGWLNQHIFKINTESKGKTYFV